MYPHNRHESNSSIIGGMVAQNEFQVESNLIKMFNLKLGNSEQFFLSMWVFWEELTFTYVKRHSL